MSHLLIAAVLGAGLSGPAGDLTWSERLRVDAQAVHDTLRDDHPGAVDPQNPAFRRALSQGLDRALARAETVTSAAQYSWALREYGASFDDGHLNVGPVRDLVLTPVWPGFVTAFRGADQMVVARAGEDGPPLGARLLSCEGASAAELADRSVGRFYGRWNLESQRAAHGWRVFATSNPYAPRPESCSFAHDGASRTYRLAWRAVSAQSLQPYLDAMPRPFKAETGLQRLPDGSIWIGVGSFATQPGNTEKLQGLVDQVKAQAEEIRGAPRLVVDLRGNSGGSSSWGWEIVRALWGEPYAVERTRELSAATVDWRASAANIEHARALKAQMAAASKSTAGFDDLIEGLTVARSQGRDYWRPPGGAQRPVPATTAPESLMRAPVFVLTDGSCFSACLDAVDGLKALGAVQVGRETSADTLYMENRGITLPSGMAGLGLPVKVYRGRKRGNNETHKPEHVFDGDLSDTAAVAAWISKLSLVQRGLGATRNRGASPP